MKKCKYHDLPGLDLNKYTPIFKGKELLKQIFTEHSQMLKAHGVELNIDQESVGGLAPCVECGGSDFIRTGTCYVCVNDGTSQGCS
jgi:hypothetical protein